MSYFGDPISGGEVGPLAWPPALIELVDQARARNELAARRRLANFVLPRQTPGEKMFIEDCRRMWDPVSFAQLLAEFEVDDGHFRIDFAIPPLWLGFEIDGGSHYAPEAYADQCRRHRLLEWNRWMIIRFGEWEVTNTHPGFIGAEARSFVARRLQLWIKANPDQVK
jgi:hypothetical protein